MHPSSTEIQVSEPITVTIKRAREVSGLGTTTIYAKIKDGSLQTTKVGRRTLVIYRSLKALLGIQTAT